MRAETIYAITDRDGRPRYVGRTAIRSLDRKLRLYRYKRNGTAAIFVWLRANPDASIIELEHLPSGDDRRDGMSRERHWIRQMAAEGHALLNIMHMP